MNKDELALCTRLRDLHAGIAEALNDYLNTHTPQYQNAGEQKPAEQKPINQKKEGVVVDLTTLEWQDMPPTDKGAWQRTETRNTHYYAVKEAIEAKHGFPVHMDGYKIWLNQDGTLGRRKQ